MLLLREEALLDKFLGNLYCVGCSALAEWVLAEASMPKGER